MKDRIKQLVIIMGTDKNSVVPRSKADKKWLMDELFINFCDKAVNYRKMNKKWLVRIANCENNINTVVVDTPYGQTSQEIEAVKLRLRLPTVYRIVDDLFVDDYTTHAGNLKLISERFENGRLQ